ncbi:MAG TPA: helix-hairpin-helix domain-containing protein, partial [Trebonia sp.]|nr:helix-hairpin-helix domain-containing protein [Trebonia sp.]
MARVNEEVAALLREYAELLGLSGGDPFRARNYERAAKAVGGYTQDLADIPDAGLTKISGVGSSIAGKIGEIRRTGSFAALDELRAKLPRGADELARVPGVGPKRALTLASELGITSASELAEAASSGRLRNLPGFGPKTEETILRGIGVAATDTALRSALKALPDDAGPDAIGAALRVTVPATPATARPGHPLIEIGD